MTTPAIIRELVRIAIIYLLIVASTWFGVWWLDSASQREALQRSAQRILNRRLSVLELALIMLRTR